MHQSIPMLMASSLAGMPEFVEAELGAGAMRRAFCDSGLPVDTPRREGNFIPEIGMMMFLDSAARQSGEEHLGALLGLSLDIANYGTWGRYVLEGRTLGDCLSRFEKSADCFFNYPGFRVSVSGDLAWVQHAWATSQHLKVNHLGLGSVGAIINIVRHYVGPEFLPTVAEIDVPRPVTKARLEEWLPFDMVYRAPQFRLAFPRDLLNTPRRAAVDGVPITLSDVRRRSNSNDPTNLPDAMREIVRLQVLSGRPNLDAAARSLNMNTRTLQRALDREGVGFRDLSQHVRMDMALNLILETDLPLADVSKSLGYSDPFNFSRAFLRQHGRRPSDFRL